MPAPSHKPDGWGIRLNIFYTTYALEHRTSIYLPVATRTPTDIATLANGFVNALKVLSSIHDVVFYGYSVTHSNNYSEPRIDFATPIPGSATSDTSLPQYKSFSLAMPGRGTETDLTFKPAPAKITWFPGRLPFTDVGRRYVYPSEEPAVSTVHTGIVALGACTRAGQDVAWYDRLATQFNAHVQRKVGA